MEALMSQFSFHSDEALRDKNFDPSTIEELMRLFELESYKAWAAMELELETEVQESEDSLEEAEIYLESAMESAMEEFRRFEEEMNRAAQAEYDGLVNVAEAARRMGNGMEKAAAMASKKYIESAMSSAAASMRSAVRAISSNTKGKKVHPS